MRAILQSSGSQASGARLFCKRTVLVISNARRSISVTSPRAGPFTAAVESRTRRGLVAAAGRLGIDSNLATGIPLGPCAKVASVAVKQVRNTKRNAILDTNG